MKKIILVFDGTHFSEGAFEFANRLNAFQPVLLTGVFLPQAELANYYGYPEYYGGGSVLVEKDPGEDDPVAQQVSLFEQLCLKNGIEFRVHTDMNDIALNELKTESLFADLLILGSQIFFSNDDNHPPILQLKEVLKNISCPVILVPEKFDFPDSLILSYDGSEDSVYAIKQFAYLFPELTKIETMLVYVNENEQADFPEKVLIEELAARHYSDLSLFKLDINPKKYFTSWLLEKKSVMLVSGSYGRPELSHLFHRSFMEEVLSDHRLPVFIAHR